MSCCCVVSGRRMPAALSSAYMPRLPLLLRASAGSDTGQRTCSFQRQFHHYCHSSRRPDHLTWRRAGTGSASAVAGPLSFAGAASRRPQRPRFDSMQPESRLPTANPHGACRELLICPQSKTEKRTRKGACGGIPLTAGYGFRSAMSEAKESAVRLAPLLLALLYSGWKTLFAPLPFPRGSRCADVKRQYTRLRCVACAAGLQAACRLPGTARKGEELAGG